MQNIYKAWTKYDDNYRQARSLMKAEKARAKRNRLRANKKRNRGNQFS